MTSKRFWPKRIKILFEDFEQMTPKAKALLDIRAHRTLCDMIGTRFLSDMKIYWSSYFPAVLALTYVALTIYTVIYYTYHNNFSHGIKATCAIGSAVPVSFSFKSYFSSSTNQQIHLELESKAKCKT